MPNIKSAKKRVLTNAVASAANKSKKSVLKNSVKAFESAEGEDKKLRYAEAVKVIDRAATKGLIHKNTAARKKSSLTKKLNAQ